METLNIDKEKAINAYQEASDELKQVLEILFGVETFKPKTIIDRIKTLDDALEELGPNHFLVKEFDCLCNAETTFNTKVYSQLCVITAALNEGWTPKLMKGERRYIPYFLLYTDEEIRNLSEEEKSRVVYRSSSYADANGGVSYADAYYDSAYVGASIGSRLAFKTRELAEYAGKQFVKLYANYLLDI